MSEFPLIPTNRLLPVIQNANQIRRDVVGRARSLDMMRWDGTPYGDHPLNCMLLHELNDLCPRDGWPVIVLIHGGGWKEGSKKEFAAFAPKLAKHGLMIASLDYRLVPEVRWPDPLSDIIQALEFLRKQQVDLSRIALWGFSAGAHLALMAAHHKPEWIRAVVAMSSPTDLTVLPREQTEDLCTLDQLKGASPLYATINKLPPRLLVHGTADSICPIEPVRAYSQITGAELIEVSGGDHGIRRPLVGAARAKKKAEKWLIDQLDIEKRRSKWKKNKKKK